MELSHISCVPERTDWNAMRVLSGEKCAKESCCVEERRRVKASFGFVALRPTRTMLHLAERCAYAR